MPLMRPRLGSVRLNADRCSIDVGRVLIEISISQTLIICNEGGAAKLRRFRGEIAKICEACEGFL
jgi:hypothetical protein